jgi:N-methylhydantoinase A
MTDAFLAMGIIDPARFNAGRMELDPELSLEAFRALDSPLDVEQRVSYAYRIGLNNVAEGLVDVAIARGVDPRDFSLVAFGAAGPLMLPGVLDHVHARRVIVPPYPGLFSALGLLSSDLVYSDNHSAYMALTPEAAPRIAEVFAQLEAGLRRHLPPGQVATARRTFDGRLIGQSWDTPFVAVPDGEIDAGAVAQMIAAFHDEYHSRFGNRFEGFPVEGVTYRVQLIVDSQKVAYPRIDAGEQVEVQPGRTIELRYVDEANRLVGEYERESLAAGNVVVGPAIVREPMSTTHVVAGQRATVGAYGEIVIERTAG